MLQLAQRDKQTKPMTPQATQSGADLYGFSVEAMLVAQSKQKKTEQHNVALVLKIG
jgi:hypothetical protein